MVLREKIFKTITDVFSMSGWAGFAITNRTDGGETKSVTAVSPSTHPCSS
jgi:hypothetical protein